MIKNLNVTLSLICLVVIVLIALKVGLGLIFSSNLETTGTAKGNLELLKNYKDNEEE